MFEEFKSINSYEGFYEVSNLGRIKSLKRFRKGKSNSLTKVNEKILKTSISKDGYVLVSLNKKGESKTFTVHSLVMLSFEGVCPDGFEINHDDGNKENNNLKNLYYCTHSENMKHAFEYGLKESVKGEKHANSKLKSKQVLEIRRLHSLGVKQRNIALKFGVSFQTISKIVNRKKWKHI